MVTAHVVAPRVGNAAFIANQAGATGGGLHSNGGNSLVDFATFTANSVGNLVVDDDEQGGGAVAARGGLTVSSSAFQTNTASLRGGAIYAEGPLAITGSRFESNIAAGSSSPQGVQSTTAAA